MAVRSVVGQSQGFGTDRFSLFSSNPTVDYGEFESIATAVVTGTGVAQVDFYSIPQTYKHLQLRLSSRDSASGSSTRRVRFNIANYNSYTHNLFATTSLQVGSWNNLNTLALAAGAGTSQVAYVFDSYILDFPNYADTSIFRTVRSFGGYCSTANGQVGFQVGTFQTSAAVTDIRLTIDGTGNLFDGGSVFALYGLRY